MTDTANHGRITQDEFHAYAQPLALDLIALFSVMHEDMHDLLAQAVKEGWTPDMLIRKMEELL